MEQDNSSFSEYSVFAPKGKRSLISDYPELGEKDEFRVLHKNELLFVWYFACKVSPLYEIEPVPERINQAIKMSFGHMPEEQKQKYLKGAFPEKVKIAIREMERYIPSWRIRAKKMLDKSFDNLEALIDIDVNDDSQFKNASGEIDWSKKKAYAETVGKVQEMLPEMIAKAESGFGAVKTNKNDQDSGNSFADEYVDTQK